MNEIQRKLTEDYAKRFEEDANEAERRGPEAEEHPRLHQARIDASKSMARELQDSLKDEASHPES